MMSSFQDRMEACPICAALIPSAQIELHVNECLSKMDVPDNPQPPQPQYHPTNPFLQQPQQPNPDQDIVKFLMEEEERIKNQRQLEELENERLLKEMLEQERLELEQERRQREVMDEQYECAICHQKFAFERMCFLDSCGHYFCQLCLAKHATAHVDDKSAGEISCPNCTTPLTALEVKTLLSPAKYDEYLTQSVTAVLAANPAQFTQCPNQQCGVVIERVHASSASEGKGELGADGRPLTEVAQRHKKISTAMSRVSN
jgi:hypothetical protein